MTFKVGDVVVRKPIYQAKGKPQNVRHVYEGHPLTVSNVATDMSYGGGIMFVEDKPHNLAIWWIPERFDLYIKDVNLEDFL